VSLRSTRRRDLRLVPVAASGWLTAALVLPRPESAFAVAAGLWLATLCAFALACSVSRARPAAAVLAICCALSGAVAGHVAAAQPARAAVTAWETGGGRAIAAEVLAVGKIERTALGWRFDATLRELSIGEAAHTAAVPVLVRASAVPDALDLGAVAAIEGTVQAAAPGERAVLVIHARGEPRVLAPPAGALAAASQLRRGLAAITADLPQPAAGLIAGLAVGDTSAVTDDLDAAMKTTSLSHLTAVSGANCAVVVGIAFGLAALCGARRGVRVGVGVTGLTGFVVLVSPEPSVVRAATMAAIAMLGVLLGRTGAGVSLLSAAVAVLLLADPWLAGSIGFALSVAATGALLLGAGPLADGLARWMPYPLALAVAVPLAAQLACGPLLILIAPQVPLLGTLANLLAAPAAPAGTVIGLLACLTAGIPFVGSGVAVAAWVPAAWIAATAELLARAPGSTIAWMEGPLGAAALAALGAAVAGMVLRGRGWVSAVSVLVLAAASGVAIALGPIAGLWERSRVPQTWSIAACDVGQGDALLVRSENRIALIDTGPDPSALTACLEMFAVSRVDLLVLTHFDADHRGGIDAIRGRIGTVLHGPIPVEDRRLVDSLSAEGARLVAAAPGVSGELGSARWRVLWPPGNAVAGNDASVVVDVSGGGVPPALFLGDLSARAQAALATQAVFLSDYAVVKVAHHGSADQDFGLYERLAPSIALVTVGENDYGHPREEILAVLNGTGAHVARTDRGRAAAVWQDADRLRVWRAAADPAVGGGG